MDKIDLLIETENLFNTYEEKFRNYAFKCGFSDSTAIANAKEDVEISKSKLLRHIYLSMGLNNDNSKKT